MAEAMRMALPGEGALAVRLARGERPRLPAAAHLRRTLPLAAAACLGVLRGGQCGEREEVLPLVPAEPEREPEANPSP